MAEPTVSDLVRRARDAATDEARAEALDAAWSLAAAGTRYPAHDWRQLLGALVELGAEPARVRACAEQVVLASDRGDELDCWGFAEAIVAVHRSDPSRAAELLAAAIAAIERPPPEGSRRARLSLRGSDFGLLAQGIATLDDYLPQVRDLLARGAARALAAGDFDALADHASRCQRFGRDPDGAVALARRAEELWRAAGAPLRPAWGLANAWHALGQLGERDRLLADVGRAATTLAERLLLARIWSSHDDPRGKDVVATAEPLATSAADCFELAETAHAVKADRELIARALRRCKDASPAPELLARAEQAATTWLGVHREHAASLRPEDLRPRRRLLPGFAASPSRLLWWLCDRMTDARIAAIAGADYGQDAAAHHAAIVSIVRDRVVPPTLPWIPGEVLGLYRWREGERVDHVARGFCVVLLLLYGAELDRNLAIASESADALGAADALDELLVDLYERAPDDDAPLRALIVERRRANGDATLGPVR